MTRNRMEAFSDGVIAIIITIMVLELKVPRAADLTALAPLLPVFLSYVLSFVFLGIYWNNHHHLLHAVVAYFILVRALLSRHGPDSVLATALGGDFKGKISMVIYLVAIPLAFVKWWLACALYVLVSIMWLVPDRRIEKTLTE